MKPATPLSLKVIIGAAVAAGLGSVVVTLYVASGAYEASVSDASHEHGLRYSSERALAAPLGLRAAFAPGSLAPGGRSLDFTLLDKAGAPVEGAAIRVALHRPAGGGEPRAAEAAPLGAGRYRAEVGFAAPGFWDVRLDVVLGGQGAAARGQGAAARGQTVGLVQQVRVEAATAPAAPCDLEAAPCTVAAEGLTITLDLGRDLATMRDLPASVEVRRGGAPLEGASVEVAFAMKDMNMGENRISLAPAGPGRHAGQALLVRCHSGRKDWIASVTVKVPGGAPVSVKLPFAVRQ
jgi:nitrogen fixation protein FixH